MNLKIPVYFLCYCLLTGCGLGIRTVVTKKYSPLDSLQTVRVIDKNDPVPTNAIELGMVRIYDNMTMHCDSVTVFNAAINEVRKAGGNILKVTMHSYPNLMSSCHQISGLILRLDNLRDSGSVSQLPASGSTKDSSVPGITPKPVAASPVHHDDWRFAMNGGYSWQTAKISGSYNSFERDYIEGLKSGYHLGGEIDYFFNEGTGISLQYNQFHSSNSTQATAQMTNGQIVSGLLSDKINTYFIAPGITWRVLSRTHRNAFLFGISVGYIHYDDEGLFIIPSEISGSSVGFSYDLGYDIGLSQSTALGLGFAWKLGTLSSVRMTKNGTSQSVSLNDNERIGIGHLDFSIGLRFR